MAASLDSTLAASTIIFFYKCSGLYWERGFEGLKRTFEDTNTI
jgi:hypothetical protein